MDECSRFRKEIYNEILESPYDKNKNPRRGLLPLGERYKRITKKWRYSKWLILLLAVLIAGLSLLHAVSPELPSKDSPDYEVVLYKLSFYGSLGLVFILFLAVVSILCKYHYMYKRMSSLLARQAVDDALFNQKIKELTDIKINYIKPIRDLLGHVYGLDSRIVYAEDQLVSLSVFDNPCYYELILGISKKLGIEVSDSEIDDIGTTIQKEARTVKDLVTILYEFIHKKQLGR